MSSPENVTTYPEISISASLGWVVVPTLEESPTTDSALNSDIVKEKLPAGGKLIRYDNFVALLLKADTRPMMLSHAAIGLTEEAGEAAGYIKKYIHYGQELDREALIKELGDIRFYLQAVMNLVGVSETEVLQTNANKLAARYAKLAFSTSESIMRMDENG